jgi:hypothetical protein
MVRPLLISMAVAASLSAQWGLGADDLDYDAIRLHIGRTRQFLFDNVIVESAQNMTREMATPDKAPQPRIQRERPWEAVTYFT